MANIPIFPPRTQLPKLTTGLNLTLPIARSPVSASSASPARSPYHPQQELEAFAMTISRTPSPSATSQSFLRTASQASSPLMGASANQVKAHNAAIGSKDTEGNTIQLYQSIIKLGYTDWHRCINISIPDDHKTVYYKLQCPHCAGLYDLSTLRSHVLGSGKDKHCKGAVASDTDGAGLQWYFRQPTERVKMAVAEQELESHKEFCNWVTCRQCNKRMAAHAYDAPDHAKQCPARWLAMCYIRPEKIPEWLQKYPKYKRTKQWEYVKV